ncbi:transposase, partial [Alteribacillus sp. JSM 102045]|uniref:transposase n=1 Tax=Alteribacillus sp. JSM 102045 TaxID=1562101 RepID=UPI0035C03815
VEKYSAQLVERSNQMYEELLEKEIIPEIERDNMDELSTDELTQIVKKLDEKVENYDQQIEASEDGSERKQLRSERKMREKLSETKTGEIYGQRKIDVEPVFGFLKANLRFTRMSVRGKEKVENELGFAFMAVNLRKYTASTHHGPLNNNQKRFRLLKNDNRIFFYYFGLVMSQPFYISGHNYNFLLF